MCMKRAQILLRAEPGVCCRLGVSSRNGNQAGKTWEAHGCVMHAFNHLSDPPFPEHTLAHTHKKEEQLL